MQITVMGQYAKGLETTPEKRDEGFKLLESVKHYLWHGNVARARDKLEELQDILDQEGTAARTGRSQQSARRVSHVYCSQPAVRPELR